MLAIGALILGGLFGERRALGLAVGSACASNPRSRIPRRRARDRDLLLSRVERGRALLLTEIANPRRTLPRVMIGGTAFVAAIYVLLNLVYLSALSVDELAQEPIVPVAEKSAAALWGADSGRLVAALLCLSIAGAVSAMTWAGPRVYWAMAQDGVITPWLAHRHPETGVPARAILFQTLWASALILSGTFEQLIIYSGMVLAFFMGLTLSAIFPLRSRSQIRAPVYRIPGIRCCRLCSSPGPRWSWVRAAAATGRSLLWSGNGGGRVAVLCLLRKRKSQDDLRETAENK